MILQINFILNMPVAEYQKAQIRGLTSIRSISMKQFKVMPEVTALTRGPFEAALTSDA